ncbi:MAG TPA: alpha/beta hydrolase [Pedococcus sp.]|jgi:pimeloyl-ACP methyl ester carboxylesterase|nr:alpha/beta hydrolase [Pedococcus sp.]
MVNPLVATVARPWKRASHRKALQISSPDGIREEGFVGIGGIEQFVTIRGQDRANPVVLVVHGGPGSPYIPFNPWLGPWEQRLTVVQWDQRGAGRTFVRSGRRVTDELSLDCLVNDGIGVAEHVRQLLPERPVVLLGSSVGSATGAAMAARRPDLFTSYVAANLFTPTSRAQSWRLTVVHARASGNRRALAELERVGPDVASWTPAQAEQVSKLAIKASTGAPDMVLDLILPALMYSPDYSMSDIRAVQEGMRHSLVALHEDIAAFDMESVLGDFPVPLMAVHGERDMVNPLGCVEEALRSARAPHVELVTVPDAGHLVEFAAVKQVGELLARAATLGRERAES